MTLDEIMSKVMDYGDSRAREEVARLEYTIRPTSHHQQEREDRAASSHVALGTVRLAVEAELRRQRPQGPATLTPSR